MTAVMAPRISLSPVVLTSLSTQRLSPFSVSVPLLSPVILLLLRHSLSLRVNLLSFSLFRNQSFSVNAEGEKDGSLTQTGQLS